MLKFMCARMLVCTRGDEHETDVRLVKVEADYGQMTLSCDLVSVFWFQPGSRLRHLSESVCELTQVGLMPFNMWLNIC